MTVMAYLLQEYANEKVDIAHVMILCLIHDLVEIDAGDTYAYDEKGKKTQREREERAADRIFGLLPEDQQKLLHALFEEFDAGQTAEAKFARSMDNLQPLLLNHSNGGSDWLEHGVSRQTVEKRQGKTRLGSAVLGELTEEILDANEEAGHFQKE